MEFDLVVIVCTFFNWRTKQYRRVSTEGFRVGSGSEASRGAEDRRHGFGEDTGRGQRDRHRERTERQTGRILYVSHTCQVYEQGGPDTLKF